jgi:hypothetical protein
MSFTRQYFATQGLFVKPVGDTGVYGFVHGVQTMSETFNINTLPVQQWGQINPYEIAELTPEGTLQVERVLDGCAPLYLLATEGASSASLTGRQDVRSVMCAAMYDSSSAYISGTPGRVVEWSGLNVNSIGFTFNTDGAFTESVGFVGNFRWPHNSTSYGAIPSNPTNSGTDEPCALTSCSGGVQLKENIVFTGTYPTLLPTDIAGISSSGTMPITNGCPSIPIQSITINCDLARETVNQLGCRAAYARYASFPVDVTCEITILSQSGDNVVVSEIGTYDGCDYTNAPEQRIRVKTSDGLVVDLGDRCKLTSVASQFGGADGGNKTYTLTYTGKSILSVYHPNDPSGFTYSGTW